MRQDRQERPGARSGRPADPHVGRLLDGRYRIESQIARGGMAGVYEAHDLRLDRTVAVKIMHAGLGDGASGDDDFAARFVREARSAARLSHPNVVAVYDQGHEETAEGTVLFIAMELVPGHTLRDTIAKEAPMAPERALALLDPVLSALASAHRAGLVHRDVKPENVLIAAEPGTPGTRIKVADFGLAKAVSADTQHTATNGVLIGTVSYLAPELVVDGRADARADVYAVGVILYELLTGRKPHTGESPIQVAYRHVHHDVPAPSESAPGIPAYVDALVARATTRDPSLRPADAGVLLHHVHRVAQALRDGIDDDPDLVADLLPSAPRPPAESERDTDTSPEPMDDLREGLASVPERTPATVRPPAPVPPPREGTTVIGDDERPRRSRRTLVLLLVAAVLAAAVGGGAYWLGWARYTTTPTVEGLQRAAAEEKIEDAGLEVELAEPSYSESVPKGEVISSDPAAGERILPGDPVTIVVSLGPERYDVPDLAGMTLDEAQDALADVKMVLGKTTEKYSETVPEGQIIRSDPDFGTKSAKDLPVDTAVAVVVSLGRKPIKVKDFTGKDADDATAKLESLGLKVEVVDHEHSDTVDEGDIISQAPTDGTLYKGDLVEIVVSDGPELIEVPAVRYESTDDAVAALEDLGFKVKIERAQIYLTGGTAWDTSPGAGELVEKGSTITLYVV